MQNSPALNAATDISRFTGLRASARRDPEAAFATVAKEFEALFIQLMLKAARDASPEGGLFNSRELKMYREMMDDQIALSMAEQGGLGFEAVLRQQFSFGDAPAANKATQLPARTHIDVQPLPFSPAPATATARARTDPAVQPSDEDFVERLRPLALGAAARLGIDAETLVAQAALETGWGKHVITHRGASSHNYFGIKASQDWAGETVEVPTREFINGRPLTVNASFRAYPDERAAFDDYVRFLNERPRYSQALQHGGSSREFVSQLAAAGYATDPHYAEKILSIRDQLRAQSTLAHIN